MSKRYRLIEHTADAGVQVFGHDEKELFLNAGEALCDIVFGLDNVSGAQSGGVVSASGENREELMVDWLSLLLLKFELENFISSRFEAAVMAGTNLSVEIYGEEFKPEKHDALMEIKAVTYHGLKVEQKEGLWTADVIFDV